MLCFKVFFFCWIKYVSFRPHKYTHLFLWIYHITITSTIQDIHKTPLGAIRGVFLCQHTAPEPASVQTLIFTHRYGVKNFSSMFQYYCPFRYYRCSTSAFSTVCTQSITYVCNDSCVVKNCVIPAITAEIPYFCLSKLMYEQT